MTSMIEIISNILPQDVLLLPHPSDDNCNPLEKYGALLGVMVGL